MECAGQVPCSETVGQNQTDSMFFSEFFSSVVFVCFVILVFICLCFIILLFYFVWGRENRKLGR